ncbi:FAD-dependent oxidoreductase [Paralimibaculum aggregatum]|uniref:FAD-dependent oxidoreductase n=1 Tax=Paralimibaculum aggregatum TaxID=3036245 RepID=A0ABQ6LLK5_9RHOB|nr:FAD-dependent oxidoreductase [Limibaculum sp. NKW23]GMG82123.1 FAD-dependent oxidoreductase [Limibaculum sp. NKW23]
MTGFPNLLSELSLGNCWLRNRIVSTGHHTYLADRVPGERLIAYHEARARGGAGLIVSEIVAVHGTAGFSRDLLTADAEGAVEAYRRLAGTCRRHGAALFAQLFHPGREILAAAGGMLPAAWAPSAVPNERFHIMPRPMPDALIRDIVAGFGRAAGRLAEAGLDGFEIVASHGYLPAQFLNPRVNLRDDAWGEGTLFLREVISAIRNAAPGRVLGLRISGAELDADGLTGEEVLAACTALAPALDYLSVTAGTSASLGGSVHITPPMGIEQGYAAPLAGAIRRATGLPVIAAGRIGQPQVAEAILARGDADLCGMTRALICDPELPRKTAAGRLDDIRACIGCNQACIGRAHKGLGISCIQHPETGRETAFAAPPAIARRKRLLVAGGGPAGMKAAAVAAMRGHAVMLCEGAAQLGGQALLAGRLPGRDEFGGIVGNLEREMAAAGVAVRRRTAVTPELVAAEAPDAVILATGALPFVPPRDGLDAPNVLTAWQVLEGARTGARVVVADWRCDWIGIGIAERLALAGSHVTLAVNGQMAGETLQLYARSHMVARLYRLGVEIRPHMRLFGADGNTVWLQNTLSDEAVTLEGIDTLVLSLGHRAEDGLAAALAGLGPELHMIGDCVAPRTAEEAVLEGLELGWRI